METGTTANMISSLLLTTLGLDTMKLAFWLVLVAMAVVLLSWYWFRHQHRSGLLQLRRQIELELHDELGSCLSHINLQAEQMQKNYFPDPERQQKALEAICTATRMANNSMRDIIWMIDTRHEETTQLLDRMHEHAEELLSPRGTEFFFCHDKVPMAHQLPLAVTQNLLLIYKEAIHNIARHSNATQVFIDLRTSNGLLTMRISDNGNKLRAASSQAASKPGLGITGMSNRALRIGADLCISTDPGYSVELKIKLHPHTVAMAG